RDPEQEPDDRSSDGERERDRDPRPDQRPDLLRVVERVAEIPVQQAAEVVAVLREYRLVEPEPVIDERDGLRRRLTPRQQPGDIVRRDEEHHEDERDDHPEHDQAEADAPKEEPRHRRFLRLNSRSPRGSNASRTLSPNRLNASVVVSRKTPGK